MSKAILRTAQQLFSENGVEAVSMHQVAKSAGIGQGTLYRRYPSKGYLCMSIMKTKFDRFMDEIERDLRTNASARPAERLSKLMKKLICFADQDLEWIRAVFNSGKLKEAMTNLFESPSYLFLQRQVRSLLEEAAGRGELIRLDPVFASSMIAASLTPEMMFYLHDLGYTSRQIAERYVETFIDPLFVAP